MRQVPVIWLIWPILLTLGLFFFALLRFADTSLLHQIPGTAMFEGPRSLVNYTETFASPLARRALWTTLVMSLQITALTIVMGYPLAYLMARSPSRLLRNAVFFTLIVTFLSGGITRAYAWMLVLGTTGPVNALLQALGADPLRLVNNRLGVVISIVHFVLPFFVLTLMGAIRNIPAALEEAARSHGATRWAAFRTVTLPLSVPGLVSAALLAFTLAISSFLFPLLLGGGRVQMFANLIYDKIQSSFDMPAAAAMAVIFLVFALLPILALSVIRGSLSRRFGGTRR
ncbi:ABC transporter permease [Oceanicella sp. SM1341]|uniref:ABC transporter permease n=1 Tax=Oceanicella sp. SM1341 TaxID=1548889 RepID=UPI000E521A46|nr:ABC transporter permease [Oceanicella sp. SM1341]